MPLQFMSPQLNSEANGSGFPNITQSGSHFYKAGQAIQQRRTADPNCRQNLLQSREGRTRVHTRSSRGIHTEHTRGFSESGGWLKNSQKTRKKKGFKGNQSGYLDRKGVRLTRLSGTKKNLLSQSMIVGGRRKKKKKFEESLLEELMQPKQRKVDEFADFSNVSLILKPKKKKKDIGPKVDVDQSLFEMRQNMERFKTMQTEKLRAQSQIVERTCAITKQGGRDIEELARRNPNEAIFRKNTVETVEEEEQRVKRKKALKKIKSYKDLDQYKDIKPFEKIRNFNDISGFMEKEREKQAQLSINVDNQILMDRGQRGIRRESQPRFAGNYSPIRRPKFSNNDFISQQNRNQNSQNNNQIGNSNDYPMDNNFSQPRDYKIGNFPNSQLHQQGRKGSPDLNISRSMNDTEKNLIFEGQSSEDEVTPHPRANRQEVEKRKFTFSMKLGKGLRGPRGLLDMDRLKSAVAGNEHVRKEILKGIEENFGEEDMETEGTERRMTGKFMCDMLNSDPQTPAVKKGNKAKGRKKKGKGKGKKKKGKSKRNLTGMNNISNILGQTKNIKRGKNKPRNKNKRKTKPKKDRMSNEVVFSRYGVPMMTSTNTNKQTKAKPTKTQSSRANLTTITSKRPKKSRKSARRSKKTRDSKAMTKKSEKKGKLLAQSFMNSSNIMSVSDLDINKSKKRRKKKIQGKDSRIIRSRRETKKSRGSMLKNSKMLEDSNDFMILGNAILDSSTRQRVGSARAIKGHRASQKRPPIRQAHNRQSKNSKKNKKKNKFKKGNKNDFFDQELIQKLRNEASSDEEPNSSGMSGVKLDISEIKSANRGVNLKEDKSGINLNYSGDSQDFIDGNISERFMSESSQKDERQRKQSKVSAFGHYGEEQRHFDLQNSGGSRKKRRQTVGNKRQTKANRDRKNTKKNNSNTHNDVQSYRSNQKNENLRNGMSHYYGEHERRMKGIGSKERGQQHSMQHSIGHFGDSNSNRKQNSFQQDYQNNSSNNFVINNQHKGKYPRNQPFRKTNTLESKHSNQQNRPQNRFNSENNQTKTKQIKANNRQNDSDLFDLEEIEDPDFDQFNNQTDNLLSNQRETDETGNDNFNNLDDRKTSQSSKGNENSHFRIKNRLKLEESGVSSGHHPVQNHRQQKLPTKQKKKKPSRDKNTGLNMDMKQLMQNLKQGLANIESKGGLTGEARHNKNPNPKNPQVSLFTIFDMELYI